MQNPTHLILSEHNIYHFRWPMPLHLMPDSKRKYVKVSLKTREPKEALYLSKILSYHAYNITIQAWARGMNHKQIRAIVLEYCQRVLEKKKHQILEGELLSPTQIADYQRTIDCAELIDELDEGSITPLYQSSIATMMKEAQVDMPESPADYERIRKAYTAAMPAIFTEIIRFNEEQSRFDFSPAKQVVNAMHQPAKPLLAGRHTLAKMASAGLAPITTTF